MLKRIFFVSALLSFSILSASEFKDNFYGILEDCSINKSFQNVTKIAVHNILGKLILLPIQTLTNETIISFENLPPALANKFIVSFMDGKLSVKFTKNIAIVNGIASKSLDESAIDVSNLLIRITMPDVAALSLKFSGNEKCKVEGSLKGNFKAHISGKGKIKVDCIETSKLTCAVFEMGYMTFDNGTAEKITVSSRGKGIFTFYGTAREVKASAWYISNIYVKEVTDGINKYIGGKGVIAIANYTQLSKVLKF